MANDLPEDEVIIQAYRAYLARSFSQFAVFVPGPGGNERHRSFESSYVELTLGPRGQAADLATGGVRPVEALVAHRLILLRGGAGAGKSTLLKWLAGTAARGPAEGGAPDQVEPPPGLIPFLVRLDDYPDGALPPVDQLPDQGFAGQLPPDWAKRMFQHGRALLLLDSLDKVPPENRHLVEEWVRQLVANYPLARFCVSTRHSVVAEQPWVDNGFATFDILPMSAHSFGLYIRRWHRAARADLADESPEDAIERQRLEAGERDLPQVLVNRPKLRYMAGNPLLCALLCALYRRFGQNLPQNRKGIYDKVLDLLEERRLTVPDIGLKEAEIRALLQRLAESLVLNGAVELERTVALARIHQYMRFLGDRSRQLSPENVLDWLLVHTGLLRERKHGDTETSIRFVHQTFRDHLAGREIADNLAEGWLLELAKSGSWQDVVAMAVPHFPPVRRGPVLRTLLNAAGAAQSEERRIALLLTVLVCLQQIDVVYETENETPVRDQIAIATRGLVPPRDPDTADRLAEGGPFVVDLLPGPAEVPDRDALRYTVRTLAMLAARGHYEVEKTQLFAADKDPDVFAQFLEAWGRGDGNYQDYAENYLATIDFADVRVKLQSNARFRHIRPVTTITWLCFNGDLNNLEPLAGLPHLQRLELFANGVTGLNALAQHANLTALDLAQCTAPGGVPIDLSPLRDLRLRTLDLRFSRINMASMDGLRVERLSLKSVDAGRRQPPRLPAGLEVVDLVVDDWIRDRRLDLIQPPPSVRTITTNGLPNQDELDVVSQLPNLRRLTLRGVSSPPALPNHIEVVLEPDSS